MICGIHLNSRRIYHSDRLGFEGYFKIKQVNGKKSSDIIKNGFFYYSVYNVYIYTLAAPVCLEELPNIKWSAHS